jgi:VCBS repeat-containing protein
VSAATQTVSINEDAVGSKFTVTATDKEGGALTYTAAGAKSGTVSGGENGTFTYTPNKDFNGTDTVTVTVKDSGGLTTTQTVTVNVAAVNDAPTIGSATQTINTDENKAVTGNVSATDVDGDTLTYTIATQGKNGSATIGADGKFTYTPTANVAGQDTFVVSVTDGKAGTVPVTQTITVNVTDLPNIIDVKAAGTNTDADNVDTTYNVSLGTYTYTITGFDVGGSATTGDRIIGPAGVGASFDNPNTTDGRVVMTYASNGQVATVILDGLTPEQDAQIFGPNTFNAVFGSGALA